MGAWAAGAGTPLWPWSRGCWLAGARSLWSHVMRNTTCHQVTPLMTLLRASISITGLLLLHILRSRLPTGSFLCCSSQIPILKLLRPWPALLRTSSKCQLLLAGGDWRHQTGLAPAQSPCWWCGESWWWSKLVPQNGSTECHTPSPLLRRARPTVNMAPAVAKCQNLMSQKVRFCVRRQK